MQYKNLGSVSFIMVVEGEDDLDALDDLSKFSGNLQMESELVIVANNTPQTTSASLLGSIDGMNDATLHFVGERISTTRANLIGMDNAVCDWVMVVSAKEYSEEILRKLLQEATESKPDFICCQLKNGSSGKKSLYSVLERSFFKLVNKISAIKIDGNLLETRLFSRAATANLLSDRQSELMLKISEFGSAFVSHKIEIDTDIVIKVRKRLHTALPKAYRALHNLGAIPVKAIVYFALLSAMINLVYASYTLSVFLFKDDVAPGWVTLSLQSSSMFFIFSILFAMMGNVLVSVEKTVNYRMRYSIVREVRSKSSKAINVNNLEEV